MQKQTSVELSHFQCDYIPRLYSKKCIATDRICEAVGEGDDFRETSSTTTYIWFSNCGVTYELWGTTTIPSDDEYCNCISAGYFAATSLFVTSSLHILCMKTCMIQFCTCY